MKELKRCIVCVDELPGTRMVKRREGGREGGGGRERQTWSRGR